MSDSIPQTDQLVQRATQAQATPTFVALNEFEMQPDLYCHRGPDGLNEENVADLFDSLTSEGLQVPVEYYREKDGRKVPTKGHRRIAACRFLAQRNTPHFALDMKIPAIEVSEAPLEDLVVRSVMDNTQRKTLDNVARIRAAMVLHHSGVQDKRAAVALGVSEQSYRRDLLVGQHSWMLDHVLTNKVAPTHASQILKAAADANRVGQVREELAAWIATKEREIGRKNKERKDKGLKELSDAEKQVKNALTGELVKRWIELIHMGAVLDEKADSAFKAGFDPESRDLFIGGYRTNIDKENPKDLLRMIAQLSQVNKQVLPLAKQRIEEEKVTKLTPKPTSPFDIDLLRREGLDEFADELEGRLDPSEGSKGTSGEPDTDWQAGD